MLAVACYYAIILLRALPYAAIVLLAGSEVLGGWGFWPLCVVSLSGWNPNIACFCGFFFPRHAAMCCMVIQISYLLFVLPCVLGSTLH